MGGRGRVVDDDVVEVCGDAFQAFDDLVDDIYKPSGGAAAALWHNKSFDEPVTNAEHRQWDGVLVDGDLMEGGDTSEREKVRPLLKESRTSSTRGMGSCPRKLMAFSFL